MSVITKDQAVHALAKEIEKNRGDPSEMEAVHQELFPDSDLLDDEAGKEDVVLRYTKITNHLKQGLLPEEVVDLWRVVFPHSRNTWYNEEDDTLHYDLAR